ncbi:MAG: 2-polyprenyl-3-methyl-6-methoxy-1,4-benzoquinone monooxygenase [Betaproteobacteria bacterium]|jgi:ubiquinone biosynthesis monooxygenase Coq7
MNKTDALIAEFDLALRTMFNVATKRRATPGTLQQDQNFHQLSEEDTRHSAGLMRVNHVGEVCAQALYQAQRMTGRSPILRDKLKQAALEEEDHLAWCQERLEQLASRPSLLNPLWYGGAFAIGALAGIVGDRFSLGFVAETESQVEKHLTSHLSDLPKDDLSSRAIVEAMRNEEIVHGNMAKELGAGELPTPIKNLMGVFSKVMTKTAYKI